nr:hypothetical protein Itr_chr15CG09680 [Ipomoea trifida]
MQKWFSSSKAGDDAQQQRMTTASHPLLLSPGRLDSHTAVKVSNGVLGLTKLKREAAGRK